MATRIRKEVPTFPPDYFSTVMKRASGWVSGGVGEGAKCDF